jgi:hypothetical protein
MQVIPSKDHTARNNISGEAQDFCGFPIGKSLAIDKEEDVHKIHRNQVDRRHAVIRTDAFSTLASNDVDEDLEQSGSQICIRLIVAEESPGPKVGLLDRA